MIIKLASLPTSKDDDSQKAVKGNSALFGNFAHPLPVLGGFTGGFVGTEAADKIFGGNMMHHISHVESKVPRFNAFGRDWLTRTVRREVAPQTIGIGTRFAKNMLRGLGGTAGVGLGALAAMHLAKKKEE